MAITIELHGGGSLEAESVSGGGYIAAPMGAIFLGAPAPCPQLVGHYVLIVKYLDGQRGLIAQKEVAGVYGHDGEELEYGNSRFPGHPDYDPRENPDPHRETIDRIMNSKFERFKNSQPIDLGNFMMFEPKNNEKFGNWTRDNRRLFDYEDYPDFDPEDYDH